MKPLRVLSPIEPGELCWVKAKQEGALGTTEEWWLVRAADTRLTGCEECCFVNQVCPPFDCSSAWSRVHTIPIDGNFPLRTMEKGTVYVYEGATFYMKDGDGYASFRPPEE